jgi:hypothetical protein
MPLPRAAVIVLLCGARPSAAAAPKAPRNLCFGSGCAPAVSSTTVDAYPRLGSLAIGDAQAYTAPWQAWAAKHHVNIIGGNWESWEAGRHYTKESVISSVKSQSKIKSRVFQYVNLNESPFVSTASWFPTYAAKVNSMNWWLYVSGTSGARSPSSWNASWGLINMSTAAPRDPGTGLLPYEWGAKYVNDFYHLGLYSQAAVPSLDGFFLDNVMWKPRANGDWDRKGSTQSQNWPSVQHMFRNGQKTFYDELKLIWPTGAQFGNTDIESTPGADYTPIAPGVLTGALIEGAIGYSWSFDTWSGSAHVQTTYKAMQGDVLPGGYVAFGHANVTSNGADPTAFDSSGNPTAYGAAWQGMRYGLAAALMGDGYYTATSTTGYSDVRMPWFDEFDGGGALGVGYLGQPTQPPQTASWTNGVWKREFEHGIALWNPKGNGAKSVSVSGLGNLKHLTGAQNSTLNNGSSVTGTVTLQDRDGLILIRY